MHEQRLAIRSATSLPSQGEGVLDESRSDWFDGLIITPQSSDETLLTGPVADQAALHSLVAKIRGLGLPVVQSLGVTEFFLGVIIVSLVGNVAEHLAAVQTAWKNKMDLSLAISLGSSMQIALFVAPLLVFISLLGPEPLSLIFNQFELISLGAAVGIAALVSLDGESNWLEGAELLAVYCIIAIAFFFLPS